jgi:transcription elongation GreA/GreB family factor
MSRAFVRESEEEGESLPERVVSIHPNLVTPSGLRQIEADMVQFETARQRAREAGDQAFFARSNRDPRYWAQRRATARVVAAAASAECVRFGSRVTVRFADGTERTFKLVGEDEANPALGPLSWVAPLAAAILGHGPGEVIDFQDQPVHIMSISSGA